MAAEVDDPLVHRGGSMTMLLPATQEHPDEARCPICGESARKRWRLRDRYWEQPGEWDLFFCRSCGHAFIWPVPADLDRYYEHWYVGPGWDKVREMQASELTRFLHQLRLKRLSRYVDLNIRSEVLDVGCGQGIFLEEVRRAYGCGIAGSDTTDVGIEDMSPEPRRAIDFRKGELEEVGFQDEHYEMVVALHVLEHIPDARTFVRQAWNKVKPGGILAVETPNFGSIVRRLTGRYWTALEAPYHLHDFTEGSLQLLLRDAGVPDPEYIRSVPLFPEMTSIWVMAFKRLLLGTTAFRKVVRVLFWIAMWFTAIPFDIFASLVLTRVGLGGSVLAVVKKPAAATPARTALDAGASTG